MVYVVAGCSATVCGCGAYCVVVSCHVLLGIVGCCCVMLCAVEG